MCRYEKAEKAKHEIKRKAALENLEKGENAKLDVMDDDDDDKIAETEEAGKLFSALASKDASAIARLSCIPGINDDCYSRNGRLELVSNNSHGQSMS